jgi:SAM-dependent methyltransferase
MTSNINNKMDNFLSIMIVNGAFSSISNLKFRLEQIFKNIDFKGKNVLEIGGGYGLFGFYASIKGAYYVVNIEPQGAGSASGVSKKFNTLRDALGIYNVELQPSTFQDYDPLNKKFDIILLYNSINHLNEKACVDLRTNTKSLIVYKNLFEKIDSLSTTNAKIIICDCSNKNLFPLLRLKNPFNKSIEWHKHQSPNVWSKLLNESGFSNHKISWTTFNRFGKFGNVLLGNKYVSYFLTSHFCLKMDKK